MSPDFIIDLFREATLITISIVLVTILPSLIVGLIVSMFQAATQINEQTLSFLPRFIVTFVVLVTAGPWIGGRVLQFTEKLILIAPELVR
ncbi:MAG: flagellar biosynthetic protein FliQ [Gammaproteobacteria bacterium]|nr:flagellar biosynthetic protein FliQ [Gammaproteobacteria bacterium]MBV1872350.1 flagellar biosynthetic protein FliQ [Gammaproteobacteria bacterium]